MERYDSIHYEIDCYDTERQQLQDRATTTNKRDALRTARAMAGRYPVVEVLRQYTYNGDYVAFDVVAAYLNGKEIYNNI